MKLNQMDIGTLLEYLSILKDYKQQGLVLTADQMIDDLETLIDMVCEAHLDAESEENNDIQNNN